MAATTLREWLQSGPFGLCMSSGFFGFFAHCGVLTVLEDEGLLPARVSGSSAGALVAGCWAGGVDAHRLRDELLRLRREDFWDPRPGPGLLAGRLFGARLHDLLPSVTFADCRVPAAVSATDVVSRKVRVLDQGPLAPAIRASCTVPGLFQPVWIGGRPLLDGGLVDRPGLAGMPAGERVLFHHLASRSPWRRPGSAALRVPDRSAMVPLIIADLPRVGPFRLEAGAAAFERAREGTRAVLDRALAAARR